MDGAMQGLAMAAAIGCGLIGGVFFAFSAFVMAALARLPASGGIAAMQSINIAVINPWFLGAFFGTAALCVAFVTVSLLGAPVVQLLVGSALYLVGTILVTMLFNVPRNNALAAAAPDSADGARLWERYLREWTLWNHIRTAAALLAAVSFMTAL